MNIILEITILANKLTELNQENYILLRLDEFCGLDPIQQPETDYFDWK